MKAMAHMMPAVPTTPRTPAPGPAKEPGKSATESAEGIPFVQVLQETPATKLPNGTEQQGEPGKHPALNSVALPVVTDGSAAGSLPAIVALDVQLLMSTSASVGTAAASSATGEIPVGTIALPGASIGAGNVGIVPPLPVSPADGQMALEVPVDPKAMPTATATGLAAANTPAPATAEAAGSQVQTGSDLVNANTPETDIDNGKADGAPKGKLPLPGLTPVDVTTAQGQDAPAVSNVPAADSAQNVIAAGATETVQTNINESAAPENATYRPDPAAVRPLSVQMTGQETAVPESPENPSALQAPETQIDLGLAFNRDMTPGQPGQVGTVGVGHDRSAVYQQVRGQVLRQFVGDFQSTGDTEKVSIRLNPENLGKLEITFTAIDDQLKVAVEAKGPEAEAAIRENLKDLTEAILDRSNRFQHVDIKVELRDGSDQRQDQKQDERQESRQDERRSAQDQAKRDRQNEQARRSGLEWARTWAGLPEEG